MTYNASGGTLNLAPCLHPDWGLKWPPESSLHLGGDIRGDADPCRRGKEEAGKLKNCRRVRRGTGKG